MKPKRSSSFDTKKPVFTCNIIKDEPDQFDQAKFHAKSTLPWKVKL